MKKLKIFLMICFLVCFGFALTSEVHAQGGPKIFEVGDELPATTQLRISWVSDITDLPTYVSIFSDPSGSFNLITTNYKSDISINNIKIFDKDTDTFEVPYTNYNGDHAYIDIDTSTWSSSKRTIKFISSDIDGIFTWEDLAPSDPEPSGPKEFGVGDELPATTQLRISWGSIAGFQMFTIKTESNSFTLIDHSIDGESSDYIKINNIFVYQQRAWQSPYTSSDGDHAYIDIDTSSWSLSKRTVSLVEMSSYNPIYFWEDLNAPSGYTITFNSLGGTTIPDIEEATELPTPLPTPIKSGYTFVGWYYDIAFTQIANAGDTLESNITLYAKWGRTFAPKNFEVGDVLSPGQIKISWDFSDITIYEDDYIRIEGTNDFGIYLIVEDVSNYIGMTIMGYGTDIIKGNTMINLDDISVITEIKSDGNSDFWYILDALTWEYIGDYQDGYSVGYNSAREYYGFYDSSTNEWLSVSEYIDRYGTDKMDQTDFYNNFDKYFIPAMIIVFGGAIVLTLLKVFKGRE